MHHLILEQQGIPWIIRKIINYAALELAMTQKEASASNTAVEIAVKQTVRPGGFDSFNSYILDGAVREETVPIFGTIAMHADYVKAGAIAEEELLGYEIEGMKDGEKVAIREVTKSVHSGWETVTVWGFEEVQGERRYCKYCVTTKDEKTATARLVYDYRGVPA